MMQHVREGREDFEILWAVVRDVAVLVVPLQTIRGTDAESPPHNTPCSFVAGTPLHASRRLAQGDGVVAWPRDVADEPLDRTVGRLAEQFGDLGSTESRSVQVSDFLSEWGEA
jgi:hypothetical protein